MIDSLLETHKPHFEGAIAHLHNELTTLRTGRANAGILATVTVESYGSKVPLNQVASVTVSDAKTLTISPWDKSLMQAIEKGIQTANLGLNPGNDGNVIRLTLPPMTEDRRKELVKVVNQLGEQCRISIRKVREDVMKALKKAKEDGQIGEDDVVIGQKKVQDMIDSYNNKIKDTISDKEKEIMTV